MRETKEIIRKYYISFGELKKKFGIKGELVRSDLWEGLSPNDENKGISRDMV